MNVFGLGTTSISSQSLQSLQQLETAQTAALTAAITAATTTEVAAIKAASVAEVAAIGGLTVAAPVNYVPPLTAILTELQKQSTYINNLATSYANQLVATNQTNALLTELLSYVKPFYFTLLLPAPESLAVTTLGLTRGTGEQMSIITMSYAVVVPAWPDANTTDISAIRVTQSEAGVPDVEVDLAYGAGVDPTTGVVKVGPFSAVVGADVTFHAWYLNASGVPSLHVATLDYVVKDDLPPPDVASLGVVTTGQTIAPSPAPSSSAPADSSSSAPSSSAPADSSSAPADSSSSS